MSLFYEHALRHLNRIVSYVFVFALLSGCGSARNSYSDPVVTKPTVTTKPYELKFFPTSKVYSASESNGWESLTVYYAVANSYAEPRVFSTGKHMVNVSSAESRAESVTWDFLNSRSSLIIPAGFILRGVNPVNLNRELKDVGIGRINGVIPPNMTDVQMGVWFADLSMQEQFELKGWDPKEDSYSSFSILNDIPELEYPIYDLERANLRDINTPVELSKSKATLYISSERVNSNVLVTITISNNSLVSNVPINLILVEGVGTDGIRKFATLGSDNINCGIFRSSQVSFQLPEISPNYKATCQFQFSDISDDFYFWLATNTFGEPLSEFASFQVP